MDKDEILRIFYDQVLKEASLGTIFIDDWKYRMCFSSNIKSAQTDIKIMIHDKECFDSLLVLYANQMLNLLKSDPFYHRYDNICFLDFHNEWNNEFTMKAILTFLWANASFDDFLEPEVFLKRRISFIENKEGLALLNSDGYLFSLSSKKLGLLSFYGNFEKNSPVAETLYSFAPYLITESGERYDFPRIYYGIHESTCFIGGIQKKFSEKTKFQKDMDRFFYGVDHDVSNELKNIPPNLLIDFVLFFEVLKQNQIADVVFQSFYPLRNQIKEHQIEKLHKLTEEEYTRILNHVVNREFLAFIRLNYHFGNGVEILSYPTEIDNSIHVKIQKEEYVHPNLLTDLSDAFASEYEKNRKI